MVYGELGLRPVVLSPIKSYSLHEVIIPPNCTFRNLKTSLVLGHQAFQHSLDMVQQCFPVPQALATLSLHCIGLSQSASQLLPWAAPLLLPLQLLIYRKFLSFFLFIVPNEHTCTKSQCRKQKQCMHFKWKDT